MLDVFYRSLADRRRRFVLSYLVDTDGRSVAFEELVDAAVRAETDSLAPDRRSVAVALHHTHLPMLADRGLVEYDRNRGVVTTTDRTQQVVPYLSMVEELDHRTRPQSPD